MIRPTLLSVLLAMPYEVELKVIGKERPILLNGKSAVPDGTVIRCRIAPGGGVEMPGK